MCATSEIINPLQYSAFSIIKMESMQHLNCIIKTFLVKYFCKSHGQRFVNWATVQTAWWGAARGRKKLHYPMGRGLSDRNPELWANHRSPQGAPGPETFGQPVIPDPSSASDHRRLPQERGGWAGPGGGDSLASWLSCRLLQITYHSTSPRLW